MFNSVFRKLLAVYLLISVSLALALSAGLSQYFSYYFFNSKQKELLRLGHRINALTAELEDGTLARGEFQQALNAMGYAANTKILAIKTGSSVTAEHLEGISSGRFREHVIGYAERILQGETVVRKRESISPDTQVVLVGMPLTLKGDIKGVILLFSPLTEVEEPLKAVRKVLWTGFLIAVLVAAAVIYCVSRRITRPIAAMGAAARKIADGAFVGDLPVNGNDEIAQLGRTFNYMQRQLRRTEEVRRDLIANVSHELRTPLATVRGFIQGILDGVVQPQEQDKYLRLAFGETNRLVRLVSDLLDLARIQAGSLQLHKEKVALQDILQDVSDYFSLEAAAKGTVLRTSIAAGLQFVYADADRLKQVLLNLVGNAIRYTPPGGEVSVEAVQAAGGSQIKVSDTGPGVPEAELDRIFDKFHRVEKSRNNGSGGTGLGLSIAKQLVELHGGRIEAKNRADCRGLEITFFIPEN